MFYFAAIFEIIFLSLYATYTSDECHAWFHLYAASPGTSSRNTEQAKIKRGKIFVHSRIRTLTQHSIQTTSPPP